MEYYSAIVGSVALILSFANFWRDRSRIKITSSLFEGSECNPEPSIHVVVINKGRRPVILRMLGGTAADGTWSGELLQSDKGGIRLEENGRWEHSVLKQGTIAFVPDGTDIFYDSMWIEDSIGKRYAIPYSLQHIEQLRGWSRD